MCEYPWRRTVRHGTSVLRSRGCTNITIQLLSLDGKPFAFTLLNGKKFKTYGVNTSVMSPPPGQLYINAGQTGSGSVSIQGKVRRLSVDTMPDATVFGPRRRLFASAPVAQISLSR